jgi:hypothetical protein
MRGAPGRAADGGILAPNVSHYPVSLRVVFLTWIRISTKCLQSIDYKAT